LRTSLSLRIVAQVGIPLTRCIYRWGACCAAVAHEAGLRLTEFV
jgi:hypothetical protein